MERREGLLLDSDEPADAPVLVHEPTGRGDLAVRHGRLHPGQFHAVRHGALLALRMEQPAPVQRRQRRRRKPILHLQQLLVHYGHLPAPGIRSQSQGLPPHPHPHPTPPHPKIRMKPPQSCSLDIDVLEQERPVCTVRIVVKKRI